MADFTRVEFAVEWNSAAVVPGTVCGFRALPAAWSVAAAVINTARNFGHIEKFVWGNADAWATDYEHPAVVSTGDSLNMVDNTHLMYVSGHGAAETAVSLASNHFGCRAFYRNMRLGVRRLRWLVLDLCDAVTENPDVGTSVMRTWDTPTSGVAGQPRRALHVLCAFIGTEFPGIDTNRGAEFLTAVSRGTPVGTAWLDAAFARSGSNTNRPIAIACGRDGPDSRFRRDHGKLSDRDAGPVPSNHLAWKWRS
ncbi:hypothetical protein IU433_28415 [Nocardia puris]|uniref:Uncharacterized protein n=1 Tax=Nocardia puris TaxID=208602 RepID=A0A366CTQ7_9NOCA|nr:DUF6345 domain-containing protein [Nocardia puris]MBF6213696.1 hypothetical protein [Nocardia puris]MBF6368359.1 hypothetical protein [Nocardia puris]MBF6462934.1 hypothetical protein [Nocardia puris]RBO79684.1 hypothetical protein DFR74_13410 [Nocardia puris]